MDESSHRHVIERHWSRADQAADPYPRLPFDLPPGAGRLEIRYEYSDPISSDITDQRQGNVIDLGLIGPDGFRGWSGSARRAATLTAGQATPGYLPGPLVPGRWQVLLGLYRIAEAGCEVRVEIEFELTRSDTGEPERSDTALRAGQCAWEGLLARVAERGARWFKGDLHCHSHHSEAEGAPADVLAAARAQGLDFVAITEHNTVSHLLELAGRPEPPEPLVIPAVEITTYRGHANALGIRHWPDFRCLSAAHMASLRAAVQASGALFVVNHPKMTGPPWEWGDIQQADAVEAWQQPWTMFNYQSLGVWDGLLKQGHRLVAVGGSDKHQGPFDGSLGYHEIGQPATWVYAEELSVPGLLAGLRAGHVLISAGPRGPRLELGAQAAGGEAMMGDALALRPGETARLYCRVSGGAGHLLRLVSAHGKREMAIDSDDFQVESTAASGDGYWRAEVVEPPPAHQWDDAAAQMVVALSNPIYITA